MAQTYTIPAALSNVGAFTNDVMQQLMAIFHHTQSPFIWAVNGAIDPHTNGLNIITKAGVGAFTLAAPTSGADDGICIEIPSITAFAHVITVTGLKAGLSSATKLTYLAFAGCSCRLLAYQGNWYLLSTNGVTPS